MMRLLACDFGTKIIGVAYGTVDENNVPAVTPIPSIKVASWQYAVAQIITLVKQYKIDTLVFGNPLNQKGEETLTSLEVKKFTRFLTNRLKIPLILVNESYTTKDALEQNASLSYNIHSQSAELILLNYLEQTPQTLKL